MNIKQKDPILCESDIVIRVKNGVAVISGMACSINEKSEAEKAAKSISGVFQVYNLVKAG